MQNDLNKFIFNFNKHLKHLTYESRIGLSYIKNISSKLEHLNKHLGPGSREGRAGEQGKMAERGSRVRLGL